MRTTRAPNVVHVVLRPTARIIAGYVVGGLDDPGVHVHGDGVFLLAGLRHAIDVARVVPAHEDLVRFAGALAEHLFPGSGGFEASRLPDPAELGQQVVLVLLEIVHQLPGDLLGKGRIPQRRPVARVADEPHFVLQLDHDDAVGSIHLANMAHQSRKSAGVRRRVVLTEGRKHFHGLAVGDLSAGEALLVGLHPRRGETREPVFPAREPQPGDAHVVLPGILNGGVRDAEIVLAFLGLDPVPGHARQDGVQVDPLGQHRPHRLHVLQVGGNRIVQLAGKSQEGFAVHYELCGQATLLQMGNAGVLRAQRRQRAEDDSGKEGS